MHGICTCTCTIVHVHAMQCHACMYRLYTEVKVSTRFIKLRAEGTRFEKSSRDCTEVYNAFLPCYSNAFHSQIQ